MYSTASAGMIGRSAQRGNRQNSKFVSSTFQGAPRANSTLAGGFRDDSPDGNLQTSLSINNSPNMARGKRNLNQTTQGFYNDQSNNGFDTQQPSIDDSKFD
jgi:hypothetical protein